MIEPELAYSDDSTGLAQRTLDDLADEQEAERPLPLLRLELPEARPFPLAALGVLAEPAAAIQEGTRAPAAICGQVILGAAAVAVQAHADVELPTGAARPTSLFEVTIAESGERKSASFDIALAPVRRFEREQAHGQAEALTAHRDDLAAWERQRADTLRRAKTLQAKKDGLSELGAQPPAPLLPFLVCTEPSFEGLCRFFANGRPALGVFSSEGGQFLGGYAMRDEHRLATAAGLSSLWDGEPIRRVRAGEGAYILAGRRLSLDLLVQPAVAIRLHGDELLRDQGLLSRILITAPTSTIGTRFWQEPSPAAHQALDRYSRRLGETLRRPLPLAPGERNVLAPRRLRLSPEARVLWIRFADHTERAMGAGGELVSIRGFANKLPEHAARLAAVIALTGDLDVPELSAEDLARGIELAEHFASEAVRLREAGALDPALLLAERVRIWLIDWPEPVVSLPDLYRRGPRAVRTKKEAARVVAILEDHGWLRRLPDGAVVAGVRRREAWAVIRDV